MAAKLQHEIEGKKLGSKVKNLLELVVVVYILSPSFENGCVCVCVLIVLMHTVLGSSWVPALYTWAWLWLSIALLTFLHRSPLYSLSLFLSPALIFLSLSLSFALFLCVSTSPEAGQICWATTSPLFLPLLTPPLTPLARPKCPTRDPSSFGSNHPTVFIFY